MKHTKRLLSILVSLCLVIGIFPVVALAGTPISTTNPTLSYAYDEQTKHLTISGQGALDDQWFVNTIFRQDETAQIVENVQILSFAEGITSLGWAIEEMVPLMEQLRQVELSSTVVDIADTKLQHCTKLESIHVSEKNPAFTSENGVLFNKDKTSLIIYPQAKMEIHYVIPTGVTTIKEYSFADPWGKGALDCLTIPVSVMVIEVASFYSQSLTDIYYEGSEAQWKVIDIGGYNDVLETARIHYNSEGTGSAEPGVMVSYFRSWDKENKTAYFDEDVFGCSIPDSIAAEVDSLVGKYVIVETENDPTNPFSSTLLSIRVVPVSKCGMVTAVTNGQLLGPNGDLTIDGIKYPSPEFVYDILIGKPVLYHLDENGDLLDFEELEETHDIFRGWNESGKTVTIGDREYPTNYVTDFSFVKELEKMQDMQVIFWKGMDSATTLFKIVDYYYPGGKLEDFDPAIYRASFLQTVGDPSVQIVKDRIYEETPSEKMIGELQESGFEDAVATWEAIELIFDTFDDINAVIDFAAEPQELYMAVILDSLEKSVTYDMIANEYEDALEYCDDFISLITDLMSTEYGIQIAEDNSFKNLTQAQKERLSELTEAFFEAEQPDLTSLDTVFNGITMGIDGIGSLENYFERIVSCMTVANVCESMKTVMRQAYEDSRTSGNLSLQLALMDCVEILDASAEELMFEITADVAIGAGVDATGYFIQELLWSKVTDKVKLSHPAVAAFCAAYKVGSFVSNQLFGTDETSEQYMKMLAVTDFEHLIDYTYEKLRREFVQQEDVTSAMTYLSALDLVFELRNMDTIEAYEFVDILDETLVNKIAKLFGKDNYAAAKQYLNTRQKNYSSGHKTALTAWIEQLEGDFPRTGLYEKYAPLIDKEVEREVKKEFVAACPVDVYVYDQNNQLVASVVDRRVTCSGDVTIVLYADTKTIWFYDGAEYRVEYVGTNHGEMDITISEFDDNEKVIRTVNYYDVALLNGTKYSIDADDSTMISDAYSLVAQENGAVVKHDYDSLEENEKYAISMENGTLLRKEEIFLTTEAEQGETLEINAFVPEGYRFIRWETSCADDIVADVASITTTLIMPGEDITVKAVLQKVSSGNPSGGISRPNREQGNESQTRPFDDVDTGDYYFGAINWAVENDITIGTSKDSFSPNAACTRAQAVTFLWRAVGSPAPESSVMPFTDVAKGAFYYDAVLWAVEEGVTKGITDTTFSPGAECTRAQIVTFLWRSQGAPKAVSGSLFADVHTDAYYADAVLWAVEEGITNGTTKTTFSPDAECTRAQIVTFLWRNER